MDLWQTGSAMRFVLPRFCLQQFEHLQFSSPDLGSANLQPIYLAAMAQTQIVGHLVLGPGERFTERFELLWRHAGKFTSVNRYVKADHLTGRQLPLHDKPDPRELNGNGCSPPEVAKKTAGTAHRFDVTVPERVCQVEAVFLRIFAQRSRFA